MSTLTRATRILKAVTSRREPSAHRTLGKSVLAVCGALAIAVLGAGTTFAYLNAVADVAAATTVTAGTAAFTVSTVTAMSGGNLTPVSGAAYGTYTLTNSGDVRLTIVPTVTPSSSNATTLANTKLDMALVASGTDCTTLSYTQWSKTGTGAATGSLAVLAARDRYTGSSATPGMTLCLRATLISSAPIGAKTGTVSYAVLLDGSESFS